MKVGNLVQANNFANWFARQARIGLVLEIFDEPSRTLGGFDVTLVRILLGGVVKVLPAGHFEVIT